MRVLKFGGRAVGSPEAARNLVALVGSDPGVVLVVSAFSGVTEGIARLARGQAARDGSPVGFGELAARHREALDALAGGTAPRAEREAVEELLASLGAGLRGLARPGCPTARELDALMAHGSLLSAAIVAAAFRAAGIPAEAVDARDLIVAEGPFGRARPLREPTERAVRARLGGDRASTGGALPVVSGSLASSLRGETLTLGRGGPDFSAALVAAALGAEELGIWTDVDGIMSADPRKVADAFGVESLDYEEAMELAHFGAKVIHPAAIQPALERGIPIRIRNAFNPAFPGTVVRADPPASPCPVRGVSSMAPATLLLLQGPGMVGVAGIAGRLFGCLASAGVNVILISQASSERSICLVVEPRDRDPALEAIRGEFAPEMAAGRIAEPRHEDGKAVLAVVGRGMRSKPGISGRIFHALGASGVNVVAIAQGSSELNVSAVVDAADEAKALRAVHDAFFLAGARSVNLFLVGHGLVGGTLLRQVGAHRTLLFRDYAVRVNLVGLADSRRMLVDPAGIDPDRWRERLEAEGEPCGLGEFVARAAAMGLPNAAFADCSASELPPRHYPELLRASIAVVTPNKKGNSGTMAAWREAAAAAMRSGAPYLYETTVGAGLPVISTLRDLLVSGDRVLRIDAMLSGTIGYIFANYDGGRSLASLVRKARELGYTEPDPREDLGAADCARKALILAREAGFPFEREDIAIEPIVSEACMAAPGPEESLDLLEGEEEAFRTRYEAAKARGRGLVYAVSISAGGIRLGFRETAPEDPLHGLRDAENAVAFWTERYSGLPLVVRGPGAGAAVTAGGVFADIVRVARSRS